MGVREAVIVVAALAVAAMGVAMVMTAGGCTGHRPRPSLRVINAVIAVVLVGLGTLAVAVVSAGHVIPIGTAF